MAKPIYFPPEDLQSEMCKYLFMHAAVKFNSNKSLGKPFIDTFKSLMESPVKVIYTYPKDDNTEIRKARTNTGNCNDYFYQTKQNDKETELLCFLRHLRNIIAHGQLREDITHTKFILEDVDYHNNRKHTAYGVIAKEKVSDIINAFLKINYYNYETENP